MDPVTLAIVAAGVLYVLGSQAGTSQAARSEAQRPTMTAMLPAQRATAAAPTTTAPIPFLAAKFGTPMASGISLRDIAASATPWDSDNFVYTGLTLDDIKLNLVENTGFFPVRYGCSLNVRNATSADERYGGIDITLGRISPVLDTQHNVVHWHKVHLRPKKLALEVPRCIGWKNRMPYDVGHINRRLWCTDIQLQHPNGSVERFNVHDDYHASEDRGGYVLDDTLLFTEFNKVTDAMAESICRMNGGGVEGLVTYPRSNNEASIPYDGSPRSGLTSYRALSDLCVALCGSPNFTFYIKHSHKSYKDDINSVVNALYNSCGYRRAFHYAGKSWGRFFEIVTSIASIITGFAAMEAGSLIRTRIGEEGMARIQTMVQKIMAFASMAYRVAISMERFVGTLQGKKDKEESEIRNNLSTIRGKISGYLTADETVRYLSSLAIDENEFNDEENTDYVTTLFSISSITVIRPSA